MAAFFLGFHSGGRAVFTGAPFQPRQQVTFAIAHLTPDFDEWQVIASGGSPDRESAGCYVENVGGGLVVAQVADVGRDDFGGHDMRSISPAWLRYGAIMLVLLGAFFKLGLLYSQLGNSPDSA